MAKYFRAILSSSRFTSENCSLMRIFFSQQSMLLPDIRQSLPDIKIDWEVLRTPLSIELPSFSVNLQASPTSTFPAGKAISRIVADSSATSTAPTFSTTTIIVSNPGVVSLIAEIEGLSQGPFVYRFDCDNDGKYELETQETSRKLFRAENLCRYPKVGSYKAKVTVEGKQIYYKKQEQLTETKISYGTTDISVVSSNIPPEISFCDVSPTAGTTEDGFKFSFIVRASDANGDALSYDWQFGDSESSQEMTPLHSYKQVGLYVPKVTVTDINGGKDTCVASSLMVLEQLIPFRQIVFPKEVGRQNPFIEVDYSQEEEEQEEEEEQ